jgi:hypothetical protein
MSVWSLLSVALVTLSVVYTDGLGPEVGLLLWFASVLGTLQSLAPAQAIARLRVAVFAAAPWGLACSLWLDRIASKHCDPLASVVFEIEASTAYALALIASVVFALVVDRRASRRLGSRGPGALVASSTGVYACAGFAAGLGGLALRKIARHGTVVQHFRELGVCPIPGWLRMPEHRITIAQVSGLAGPPGSWLAAAALAVTASIFIAASPARGARALGLVGPAHEVARVRCAAAVGLVVVGALPLVVALLRGLAL